MSAGRTLHLAARWCHEFWCVPYDLPMQDFRRIDAWKRAHALAINVRRATRTFPRTGFGDLKTQIVKAAESVPTNIVEGCGASSKKEFARFLDISIKSTFELEYQLLLAKDNGVLLQGPWRSLTKETVEIRKMLCAYRRSVINAIQHKASNERNRRPPQSLND